MVGVVGRAKEFGRLLMGAKHFSHHRRGWGGKHVCLIMNPGVRLSRPLGKTYVHE